MLKNLCSLDFIREYRRNKEFRTEAKMVIVFAFVPIKKINECIDATRMELPNEI